MTEEIMQLRKEDLLLNPASRVPVALCLDVSGSMAGEPIAELNEGIGLFFDALYGDADAKTSAEVAIVTFSDQPKIKLDFQSLDRIEAPPILTAETVKRSTLSMTLKLLLMQASSETAPITELM